MRKAVIATCIPALLAAAGCGSSYYRVTDPATGKAYYTTHVERETGGAVRIKDAGPGDQVTLQNSQVTQLNEE